MDRIVVLSQRPDDDLRVTGGGLTVFHPEQVLCTGG